ncbi:hypothetical protein C8A03DRAFT_36361 [Achaetomium macrosporum]|uniref:Tetraspanin Tsp3 n=1 Tax=Achaetomium macrosporum TaxID=79813 RepID=A0AAN7HC26_9PEZI|nr:hypothetical protein C8A03DRAFT_36361 [Achaetomium macrosporum]
MALILILYSLIILALIGIAIYEHITIATLSLPISPALTVLSILLPFLSLCTTLFTPHLFHPRSPQNRNRKHITPSPFLPLPLQPLLPYILHISQQILTTILATLFAQPLTSPSTTSCLLHNKWLSLYSSHNADAIRRIQDSLACCGFRTPHDMAWPFPRGSHPSPGTCEAQFGRHTPCLPEWEETLRRVLGGELGVVLSVGALQVLVVFLVGRYGGADGDGWMRRLQRVFWSGNGRDGAGVEGSRRPLLAAPAPADGEAGRVDEEEVADGEQREGEGEERGNDGYGGVGGAGPRVEPAHHDPWAGVQRG